MHGFVAVTFSNFELGSLWSVYLSISTDVIYISSHETPLRDCQCVGYPVVRYLQLQLVMGQRIVEYPMQQCLGLLWLFALGVGVDEYVLFSGFRKLALLVVGLKI